MGGPRTTTITRVCRWCGQTFDLPPNVHGHRRYCDVCRGDGRNVGLQKKARHLRHRYGISAAEYREMEQRAGGVCEACGQPPSPEHGTNSGLYLHVDHDHATRRVRGLLCHPCNLALGYAQEDPARLDGLARYIRDKNTSSG